MTREIGGIRRVFVGETVGVIFGILLAGTVLIQGAFVPGYIAVLYASGLRNVYLPWLGSGAVFYSVVCLFLYLQAVVLAGLYFLLRHLYARRSRLSG